VQGWKNGSLVDTQNVKVRYCDEANNEILKLTPKTPNRILAIINVQNDGEIFSKSGIELEFIFDNV
jgi:hypothetical protein